MVQQVAIIFAGVNGYLDDVPIELCRDFEQEFMPYLETRYAAVLQDIQEKKEITPETEERLRGALESFQSTFLARLGAA
jgi:F-type H+-transporting ATPase subunit alpha